MKFNELNNIMLIESINDMGIFKALFVAGMPGSGKSTIAKQLAAQCKVHPKILDYDHFYEYLSKKYNVDIGPNINLPEINNILTRAQYLSRERLTHYIHNMLPLIISGTASNPSYMLNRIDILYSMGYDIGMVWVKTDVENSLKRASTRTRYVSPDYIKHAADTEKKNMQYLREKISILNGPFIIVDNNSTTIELTDIVKQINQFFTVPIINPTGMKYTNQLKMKGSKSLSPHIYNDIADVGIAMTNWDKKRK